MTRFVPSGRELSKLVTGQGKELEQVIGLDLVIEIAVHSQQRHSPIKSPKVKPQSTDPLMFQALEIVYTVLDTSGLESQGAK